MVFHNQNLKNISYISQSKFLLYTIATEENFVLYTESSQYTFYYWSAVTSYQNLSCYQKFKEYAKLFQTKKIR